MSTLEKHPARRTRSHFPFWNTPLNRFLRSDFPDFWDSDLTTETVPSINITEEKDHYLVDMAAPGLKKEDFSVDVEGNLLTISAETESEEKEEGKEGNYKRREYNYSSFSRTVPLPEHADTKNISAKYTDGILKLNIPKKPEAQESNGQKIKVQ